MGLISSKCSALKAIACSSTVPTLISSANTARDKTLSATRAKNVKYRGSKPPPSPFQRTNISYILNYVRTENILRIPLLSLPAYLNIVAFARIEKWLWHNRNTAQHNSSPDQQRGKIHCQLFLFGKLQQSEIRRDSFIPPRNQETKRSVNQLAFV